MSCTALDINSLPPSLQAIGRSSPAARRSRRRREAWLGATGMAGTIKRLVRAYRFQKLLYCQLNMTSDAAMRS
jgi:hypothetical protein